MANNIAAIKRGWHYNPETGNLEAYNNGNEIFQYPYGTRYYVSKADAAGIGSGVDTNSGLSWSKSFLTIQAALTAAATAGTGAAARRGGVQIYVAGGYYAESLTTPTNAQCPFGQLIAYSPSDISHGAVYVASGATDEPWLTVLARGWRISGFEVECPTAEAGIKLDDVNGNPDYAQVDGCHFTGGLIGIDGYGAPPYVTIKDNLFSMMTTTNARAITSTSITGSGGNPAIWVIENNYFAANNVNHIHFGYTGNFGSYSAIIRNNVFASQGVTQKINLSGGQYNIVTQNFFGGAYTVSGGYKGTSTDEWYGNYANTTYALTQADPT